MCDPSDIRALPMMRSPFSQHPTIYLYDNFPGGIGLSFKLFNDPVPTLQGCLDLVQSCGCESGCPSCVGPVLETGENAREHAFRLLKFVLEELNLSKMK
jgi:DEAD/DEAH box helicase domain-containing protein